jgi:tetratricopeptide (TPR) repeat protein
MKRWFERRGVPLLLSGLFLVSGALSGCVTGVSRKDLAQEYYNLANAYFELEEFDKASEYYRRALQYDPSLVQGSYNLARLYIQDGRYDDAVGLLESLLERDTENLMVRETLGYALYRAGRTEAAVAVFEDLAERSPLNVRVLYNLGLVRYEAEDYSGAAGPLEEATRIAPDDLDVVRLLGFVKLEIGDPENGTMLLERYNTSKPGDTAVLAALARAYRDLELYGEAVEAYTAYLAKNSQDGAMWFEQAVVLLTAIEDAAAGLEALGKAEQAGFDDRERVAGLLDDPELMAGEEIRAYLSDFLTRLAEPPVEEDGDTTADSGTGETEEGEP